MDFILTTVLFLTLAFLQAATSFSINDLLGQASTPLSVAIVIVGFRWVFSAWREDTQKNREDNQQFFETLKELIKSLETERKAELADLSESFDNLAGSIRELVAKVQ